MVNSRPIKITWPGTNEYEVVDERGVLYRFGRVLTARVEGTGFDDVRLHRKRFWGVFSKKNPSNSIVFS
jgi:hypothetical protein